MARKARKEYEEYRRSLVATTRFVGKAMVALNKIREQRLSISLPPRCVLQIRTFSTLFAFCRCCWMLSIMFCISSGSRGDSAQSSASQSASATARVGRPTCRQAIVDWFREVEIPKEVGTDPQTKQHYPWFHGLLKIYNILYGLLLSPETV